MPTAEQLAYVGAFTGAVIGIAAVVGLIWLGFKRFLRLTDLFDLARESLAQFAGRPMTRTDPGEPGMMDRMRTTERKLDELAAAMAAHIEGHEPEVRQRRPSGDSRRRRAL